MRLTVWPAFSQRRAKPPPTFPLPMTAMFMLVHLSFRAGVPPDSGAGVPPDRSPRTIHSKDYNSKDLDAEECFCHASGMDRQVTSTTAPSRIQWLSDLVRVEIVLWGRIDRRLREEHGLPLAFFEALYFVARTHDGSLRVGDLARALRVTVGGTSKLVDRVEAAGLLRRGAAPDDRRASLLVLTGAGARALAAASRTYEAEMAAALDAALSPDEQRLAHALVARLLAAQHPGVRPAPGRPRRSR
jgi:DNA-binding MarR family transcriptional regulator